MSVWWANLRQAIRATVRGTSPRRTRSGSVYPPVSHGSPRKVSRWKAEPQKSPQGFPMEGVNIPPHHVVHQTVGDFMRDKDTQLAYVLGMIAGK